MSLVPPAPKTIIASLFLLGALTPFSALAQNDRDSGAQLPPEVRGAKVYSLPEETRPGSARENLINYRNLSYESIDLQQLTMNLFLSVKPVDRAATIRGIYFQDIRASGIPVHIESFAQAFKLSKKDVVDLPGPLKCSFVFSDLDSLKPLKEIVEKDTIRITGRSFIEVKLNAFEKLALRSKKLVLPVTFDEEVPLQMFSGHPFLQATASKILDGLMDPSSTAAVALARERLAKLAARRTLTSLGQSSAYLLYCEYVLRDPSTQAAEKFSELGTGFVVSADGKLLTAKRVIQPWKFDPQIAFLLSQYHLELDAKSYKVWAWPAGARVLSPDSQPDSQTALSTDKQTLRLLKTAPDRMESKDYHDPDSGRSGTLSLHAAGESDLALLQLVGTKSQALAFADPGTDPSQHDTVLLSFPFGLSQAQNKFQLSFVSAAKSGHLITLDHQLNPGEPGSPLLTLDGKVLGIAGGSNECIPIGASRALIQ